MSPAFSDRYGSVLRNGLFALQFLLAVMLLLRDSLEIPSWLQWMGRTHPLFLHFPIAFLLLLIVVEAFERKWSSKPGLRQLVDWLWPHAALLATLTAISGLILSLEGGYDETTLDRHKWLGSLTAFLSYAGYLTFVGRRLPRPVGQAVLAACTFTLLWGSHLGGTLTHGDDFLSPVPEVEMVKNRISVTDSSAVFASAVRPVLEAKCMSCHNDRKAKDGFNMAQTALLLQGGEEGPPWVAGRPDSSLMIRRIMLALEDDRHMPPKGKPQLTPQEIELLHRWIADGADLAKTFRDYSPTDSFAVFAKSLAGGIADARPMGRSYGFPPADAKLVTRLNNPYRVVAPVDRGSPALDLSFFIGSQYKPVHLEECLPIAEQVVSVSLRNIPAGDEAVEVLSKFPNLERLSLAGSNVSGKTLGKLASCGKLESVSLSQTKVDMAAMETLAGLPALKKVFLWKTSVGREQVAALRQSHPGITWEDGIAAESLDVIALTPPLMVKPEVQVFAAGEGFMIRHPMKGVTIRYTLDGKDPDSTTSPVFKDPIPVKGPTRVKARAVMDGWLASPVAEFTVYARGIPPESATLLTQPDKRYLSQGAPSLFDGLKGESRNALINWLGFRDAPFKAHFRMSGRDTVRRVVLSMADNHGSYIMPPARITVYAGQDSSNMRPVGSLTPPQPKKYGPVVNRAYIVDIKPGTHRHIMVQADPVSSLPAWHNGRKDKGWVFVDEVFFE
jgi:hypothetical protein